MASKLKSGVLLSIILRKTPILLLLLVPGCDPTTPRPQGVIDPEFIAFKDQFVAEARSRNIELDLTGLSIVGQSGLIKAGTDGQACGMATYMDMAGIPSHVQIAETRECWTAVTEEYREELIFHELGHALLKRKHDNTLLPNTTTALKSIMNGTGYLFQYTKFTPAKRKYYIDELFDPSTPIPDWAKEKQFSKPVLNDTLVPITEWRFHKLSNLDQAGTSTAETTGAIFTIDAPTRHAANESSYWKCSFAPVNISVSSKLVLTVSVKTSLSVGSGGAFITLKGDAVNEAVFSLVSPLIPASGAFATYTLTLDYYPEQIQTISVLLTLEGTSVGNVSFKDVKLIDHF